jgi:hypothetical protein
MRMPKGHWLYAVPESRDPQQPIIQGCTLPIRLAVRDALRTAFQHCTHSGQDEDFDVDAVVIEALNTICGFGGPAERARSL